MLQKGKNILVITYWDFNEAHVQANVLPNLKFLSEAAGESSNIYLFCLNKKPLSKHEIAQAEKILSPFKIRLIWFNYSHFGIKMILKFTWLIPFLCYTVWIKKIKQVFAWCTTAGAIGYIVSVMTRRPLILESYEPHAESMVENGHWSKSHLAYQVLSWFEKKQAQRATYIIAANGGMRDYVKKRYDYLILEEKFFVKPACVDLNEFYPDASKREAIRKKLQYRNEDIVCLYAGKFGGIYLKEEIFDFLKAASDFWADRFKILLLTSHSQNEVKELCNLADIPFNIFTVLFVRHEEVPQYMRAADFAICPVKPVPTKRYCTPVKNGEYWAMGLPVIITRDISDDSHIIENENAGAVLYNLTADAYRKANKIIDELLVKGKYELTLRIRELATQHRNYKIAEKIYGTIYGKI